MEDVAENATTVDESLDEQIVQKAESFIQSNHYGVEMNFNALSKIFFKRKGVFACVLVGKNTGESLVMQDWTKTSLSSTSKKLKHFRKYD